MKLEKGPNTGYNFGLIGLMVWLAACVVMVILVFIE